MHLTDDLDFTWPQGRHCLATHLGSSWAGLSGHSLQSWVGDHFQTPFGGSPEHDAEGWTALRSRRAHQSPQAR
jgi:hypothetical protein